MLKKSLSLLLAVLMVLSCVNIGEAKAESNQFTYVASAPKNDLYTNIYLPASGALSNAVVHAFVGVGGKVQYRMYGAINNVSGFYPLNVESDMQNKISLSVSSAQAKNDTLMDLAMAKPYDPKTVPAGQSISDSVLVSKGYTSLLQQSVYAIENLFGEKEDRKSVV